MCCPHTSLCSPEQNTFVIYERHTLVLIWHKYLCWKSQHKSCVAHVSSHLKTFCRQRGANSRPHAPEAGVISTELSLTLLTMTLVILIVTLAIMHIMVKLQYINTNRRSDFIIQTHWLPSIAKKLRHYEQEL